MGERRRRLAGWVLVLAAAVLAGMGSVSTRLGLPLALASWVAAVAAAVAGVLTARGASALSEYHDRRQAYPRTLRLSERGRLPLVRELVDPVALGVHPAAMIDRGQVRTRVPAFIARDLTLVLREVLRRDRFVLVVGESTAGKSRVAYEVMRELLPGHRVVQPVDRAAAQAAVDKAVDTPLSVMWLDDLERFLGTGGLTGQGVSRILDAANRGRYILATMRSEEYAKFSGRIVPGLESPGREALRQGWDVLRLATRLELPRSWTTAELARAERHRDDHRIDDALRHTDRFGLAEYLAAGPQLLDDWHDAWAPGSHPRGAALVLAAADARRVGIHRPLPVKVLERLHQPYLRERGGERLRPEPFAAALEWALTPLHATSSLLLPADDNAVLAFDYLIDAVEKAPVPDEALDVLIGFTTPEEALELGEIAWRWMREEHAENAFRRAETGGLWRGTKSRCHLLRERDGKRAGLMFARAVKEDRERRLGPEHPDTLAARALLAWEIGIEGDEDGALHRCQELLSDAERILGQHHRQTLEIRMGVAYWTGFARGPSQAATVAAQLATDCTSALGENDELTISVRDSAAHWTAEAGDMSAALRMSRKLLDDVTRLRGFSPDTTGIRWRIAYLTTQGGMYSDALPLWEQLLADQVAENGHLHSHTLSLRSDVAECTGKAGDPDGAVELLRSAVADAEKMHAPRSLTSLGLRCELAEWIGETGNPVEAIQRLEELLSISVECRGEEEGFTIVLGYRLAHWIGKAGDHIEAINRLEQLLNHSTQARGPKDSITKEIHKELDH
jgi:eukaryotic-like serine/threonine-protein kinase